jgi:CubicO group peptidase (beta-lactamase class C family)
MFTQIRRQFKIWFVIVLLFPALLLSGSALAQPDKGAAAAVPSQATDSPELEALLDELVPSEMDEHHIAGAVVAVVKDGEIILARGYGHADVEGNRTVDPATTLFNLGSIGKIFTFTAVMQLVEQGLIDLDADVNTYLDFEIPATYPEPITMAHLMAHTAGMDEYFFGTLAPSAEDVIPLGEYLRNNLPERVRPPGVVSAYTNFGVSLAGYIVERVSGQPYASYIEQHILAPLAMDHSTARQPLPEALQGDLSLTYVYTDGAFQAVDDPFTFFHLAPAGCVKGTAIDMAHFMIAHLAGGAFQGAQILKPDTVLEMQNQHFTADPRLNGLAHGFEVLRAENPRVIGHGGVTYHFYTQMLLVPEAGLGVFVANNSAGGRAVAENVAQTIVDFHFPVEETAPTPLAGSTTDLKALEGSYFSANTSYATAEKLKLITSIVNIHAQEDGSLLLSTLTGSQRYVEVAPLLFQRDVGKRVDLLDRFSFKTDAEGEVQYLLFDMFAYEKLPWYETMPFNLLFSGLSVVLFLSVPGAAIASRWSPWLREEAAAQPPRARQARWLLGALVALFFISQGGMLSAFATTNAILTGTAVAYKFGLALVTPVALLAVGAAFFTALAWRDRFWSTASRIHYTLVALAGVGTIWWYVNWQMLG